MGKICPGLAKSEGLVLSLTIVLIVLHRSEAEIPVVVPLTASTLTVNAVSCKLVFFCSIGSRSSFFALGLETEIQINPLPSLAIKLMFAELTASDAITKSPSFSLSSLSRTTTIPPFLISFIAEGIESNFILYAPRSFQCIFLKYRPQH